MGQEKKVTDSLIKTKTHFSLKIANINNRKITFTPIEELETFISIFKSMGANKVEITCETMGLVEYNDKKGFDIIHFRLVKTELETDEEFEERLMIERYNSEVDKENAKLKGDNNE